VNLTMIYCKKFYKCHNVPQYNNNMVNKNYFILVYCSYIMYITKINHCYNTSICNWLCIYLYKDLKFFILLYVTVWCPFISLWKTPLSTSCRIGLMITNSLSFWSFGDILISPSPQKDNFPDTEFYIGFFQFNFLHLPFGL
jgi:hypothetical protein